VIDSVLAVGALASARIGSFFYSITGDRPQIKAQSLALSQLIHELSQYDAIHLGEGHPNKAYLHDRISGTSTVDDFVDLVLPLFSDTQFVSRPYSLLRTEYLPGEVDVRGKAFIVPGELANLDRTGEINPTETPIIYRETASCGAYSAQSAKRIAKVGHDLGYVVRGTLPPVDYLRLLERSAGIDEAREHGLSEGQIRTFTKSGHLPEAIVNLAVSDHHLRLIRSDMQKGSRLIIYGGAAHNDYDGLGDPLDLQLGIADRMQREFPGKYVSVDIIKPSVIDTTSRYGQSYLRMLNFMGVGDPLNLDELRIAKLDPEVHFANYVVFLPKGEVLSKVVNVL